jgi:hypothetical protein
VDISEVAMGKLGQAASQLDNKILLYTMDAAKYEFGPARFDLILLFLSLGPGAVSEDHFCVESRGMVHLQDAPALGAGNQIGEG